MKSLMISAALALALLAGSAVAGPMHEQYLPPDDQSLREGTPEQQQLMLITEYSVVVGNQRPSNQQPIPVTAPLSISLRGKPLNKGATLSEVQIHFDGESKSLKRPSFDAASRTLTLYYPQSHYRTLVDLLRNEKVYCQFLVYANGHVWADLHTAGAKPR
ncbi:hypothetical protein RRX38_20650 [Pseudomonas sp. DTU_2021_1001937_2_SI_NGA_ILE_001]|uniref:hypothetical protein n=1 Tax=Pseudomonas sp. DTU_2021_1001937_2_SI_NGA_ILE_001 TaxID=3077589 RepID=UPI0025E0ACB5|nr:hypothetical protein [Pseudomonas sp. DTU_2021_1001937_2_SI_NGA_ILE_001]WNW13464.1 hypothetical protein RRX38_20650 [Pseudomonas sp. DTU_2021_1001937_2_SI_NGA_ILE_001]